VPFDRARRPASGEAKATVGPVPGTGRKGLAALQRSAGNRAVADLLQHGPAAGRPTVQRDGTDAPTRPVTPGSDLKLTLDPVLLAQAGLLITPLPKLQAPTIRDLDPIWMKDLLARIREPLAPGAMYAILSSLPPALAPVLKMPAPSSSPSFGPGPAGTPLTEAQITASAETRRKEMMGILTSALKLKVTEEAGKKAEWAPLLTDAVMSGLGQVVEGASEQAVLGKAAGKFGLYAAGKVAPVLGTTLLDWFLARSTAERVVITLPAAAVVGFGGVFGTVAIGKEAKADTDTWRSLRDTGLEALSGQDLPVPGAPWLTPRLLISPHTGESTEPNYRPAVINGATLTIDLAKLFPALR
jgi:hypothetical protein